MIRSVPGKIVAARRHRPGRFALAAAVVASAAMILVGWSPPAARAATNGVANPSFETAGSGAADALNWTEGTSHVRSSDKVHSGGWALKSSYTGAGTSTRSDPVTVTPNTTYMLSAYIWATNTTGGAYLDMSDIPGELTLASRQAGGTGGRDLDGFPISSTHVEATDRNTFGVLMLTLHASSYDWQFVRSAGQSSTFTDSGGVQQ